MESQERLAIFGLAANPPHLGHRNIIKKIRNDFDRVIVIPCGGRPDKPKVNDVAPQHRAWMTDKTFGDLEGIDVDLSDLEHDEFTRAIDLDRIYKEQRYDIWHIVGADLVQGGEQSEIYTKWHRGPEFWKTARFYVMTRPGFDLKGSDLPPLTTKVIAMESVSSSLIRELAFNHKDISPFVVPDVASYIERYGLYRGVPPVTSARFKFDSELKPLLVVDKKNPKANLIAETFGTSHRANPNVIVPIGGDGWMLRAIRKYWRRRIPFLGINAGHRGFLLNDVEDPDDIASALDIHQLPLLWIGAETTDQKKVEGLAFNDTWMERKRGQTAWIEVIVNGQPEVSLKADGALVATAAGSSAYARSLGATVLPHGSPHLWLCGMGVYEPENFRPVLLSQHDNIELWNIDSSPGKTKRPLRGFIDGEEVQGNIARMRIRASRIATIELLFDPRYDLAKKLRKKQFSR